MNAITKIIYFCNASNRFVVYAVVKELLISRSEKLK